MTEQQELNGCDQTGTQHDTIYSIRDLQTDGSNCIICRANAVGDDSLLLMQYIYIYTGWSKKNEATLHFPKYLENY